MYQFSCDAINHSAVHTRSVALRDRGAPQALSDVLDEDTVQYLQVIYFVSRFAAGPADDAAEVDEAR